MAFEIIFKAHLIRTLCSPLNGNRINKELQTPYLATVFRSAQAVEIVYGLIGALHVPRNFIRDRVVPESVRSGF